MDWSQITILDIIAAVTGVMALIISWRKYKPEAAKTDAEADNLHARIAETWAKQVNDLLARVEILETQVKRLQDELRKSRQQVFELTRIKLELERQLAACQGRLR